MGSRRKRGGPTRALVIAAYDHVRHGLTPARALRAAGVTASTAAKWQRRADRGEEPHGALFSALDEASAIAESESAEALSLDRDWRAHQYKLKCLNAERWGEKVQIDIEFHVSEIIKLAEEFVPSERLADFLRRITTIGRKSETDTPTDRPN